MISISNTFCRLLGDGVITMGNLLRVLNDRGSVPKVDFFVDFESKSNSLSFPQTHTHTLSYTHTHTHTHTLPSLSLSLSLSLSRSQTHTNTEFAMLFGRGLPDVK